MCLTKLYLEPKKAITKIIVYKMLLRRSNGDYVTAYREHPVVLNTTIYASEPVYFIYRRIVTGQGVHAFIDLPSAIAERNDWMVHLKITKSSATVVVVKAEIPINASYWEGNNNDIASTELFITNQFIE